MNPVWLWLITSALFLIGTLGIFVPGLPGVALVFAGTLFYAIATDFSALGATPLLVFGALAALAWLSDYLGGIVGARLGGGKAGTFLGLLLGSLLGIAFGGPPGFLLGGLLGGGAGALDQGKTPAEAKRAALFSLVGLLGAKLLQLLLALAIIIAFFVLVL